MIREFIQGTSKNPVYDSTKSDLGIESRLYFGQKFAEPITKSQLQSSSYAPSIWLVFDEFSLRESHTGFLEVPLY